VQGLILGPILYAIYILLAFDLITMSPLADDNFTVRWNRDKNELLYNKFQCYTTYLPKRQEYTGVVDAKCCHNKKYSL
jgi:hypothetical protein